MINYWEDEINGSDLGIILQIILLVGTKLQVIITKMGLRIQERGEVVKGEPVVQPGDHLFWFNRPQLIIFLINFVLFQVLFLLPSTILFFILGSQNYLLLTFLFFLHCRMPSSLHSLHGLGYLSCLFCSSDFNYCVRWGFDF